MKIHYKIFMGLFGLVLILTFINLSSYSKDNFDADKVDLFYGTWRVTELSWYNEGYFASHSVRKELDNKINKPINNFLITINPTRYTESLPNHSYKIDSPQYFLRTYTLNSSFDETLNSLNACRSYLELLKIANKPIDYLIVRDPIKDKMDSGEIDWYFISTKIFIVVDKNTLLFTFDECLEIYKCERVID